MQPIIVDLESSPLIPSEDVNKQPPASRNRRWGALGVGATTLLIGTALFGLTTHTTTVSPGSASLESSLSAECRDCRDATFPLNTGAWYIYKHTINIDYATAPESHNLLTQVISEASSGEPANLGCGGVKISADLAYNRWRKSPSTSTQLQLHLVASEILTTGKMKMSEWQDYFTDLNSDLSEFNAFMHNKVQLYTPDIGAVETVVSTLGLASMKRLSGTNNEIAHIGVQIAGRMYELVGDSSQVDTTDYTEWKSSECPEAHELLYDLEYYANAYTEANSGRDTVFPSEATGTDMYQPMPISMQMATADASSGKHELLFSDLKQISSAQIETTEYDTCTISTIDLPSMPDLRVKYVANSVAPVGEYSVKYYEDYIEGIAHELPKDGTSWSNWQDQHIGMMAEHPSDKESEHFTHELIDHVENCAYGNAIRQDANRTHAYTMYTGSMCWEWNTDAVVDCDLLCSCNPENNWRLWEETSGEKCTGRGLVLEE